MKRSLLPVRRIAVLTAALAVAGTLVATGSAMAGVSAVYWTDRDNATLSETVVSSGVTTQLVAPTGGRLQDVDLDAGTGILYFADWGPPGGGLPGDPSTLEGTISQVPKTGGAPAFVCAPGTLGDAVHQLALDPVSQQIYFTRAVSYANHEVSRVNYGPGCAGLKVSFLTGGGAGPGWFPSGLAHDPVNDILYWGDIGVFNNPPSGSVNQMTASTLAAGPLPVQLTPHVDGRGRGFALDQASQTIFLTSHNPLSPGTGGAVFAYDIMNGTETLIIGPDPDTGYWDIEIDPIAQRIWYTAYNAGEIRSANFDGSGVQVELSGLANPYGLALMVSIEVPVDIKPTSCPNPLNTNSKGVLPVAILSTASFDATQVDVTTVELLGVSPLRSNLEDVATPFVPFTGKMDALDCNEDAGDGLTDLTLKFDRQAVVTALGAVSDGDVVVVQVSGLLLDGTPFDGEDVIVIKKKKKK